MSQVSLQTGIDVARTAAFRCVAGHISEITILLTLGTNIRGNGCRDQVPALTAFIVSHITLWTDVSLELSVCRVATVGALPLLLFFLHFTHLLV